MTLADKSRNDWQTIKTLMPYLWPDREWGLRIRVVIAVLFLVFAKVINVTVPIIYKLIIDALATNVTTTILIPTGLIIAYGLARLSAQAFGDIRDAIFNLCSRG